MAKRSVIGRIGQAVDQLKRERPAAAPVDTEWLQDELERVYGQGWNVKGARDMGLDPSTLSRVVHGHRKMTAEYAAKFQSILRRPLREIYQHLGVTTPLAAHSGYFEIVGRVGIDGRAAPGRGAGPARAPAPVDMVDGFALVVDAEGTVADRWVLYYDPKVEEPARLVGRLCVVRVEGREDPVLGILRRGVSAGRYTVSGFIGPSPLEQEARVVDASAVTWIKAV